MLYSIGAFFLSLFSSMGEFGKFVIFQLELIPLFFRRVRWKIVIREVYIIGVGTTGVILLTSFFYRDGFCYSALFWISSVWD